MMPPGYVPMSSPGMQGQPVYMQPQQTYNQMPPPQYAQGPNQQRPVIRSAAPEEKKVIVNQEPPVSLPAPDKLGIATQAPVDPSAIDWNATHAYLKTITAQSFGTERLPAGTYRFSVVMPTAETGKTYRIEGDGTTEAEAVRVCLDKTYRWLKQIP